jgi:hypothetical protein
LVKVQIDNSLSLNWNPKDIILATNFPYEYRGVKAIEVGDCFCPFFLPATKLYTLNRLFDMGLIKDDTYWYHDFDAYEFYPFSDDDLKMGKCVFGLANYMRRPRLCSASMFLKKGAKDMFDLFRLELDKIKTNDEEAIMKVLNRNEAVSKLAIKLNPTYAFHRFNIMTVWPTLEKPIRVAHFHPTPDKLDFFMYGHNKLNMPLLPERLIRIFQSYGYK